MKADGSFAHFTLYRCCASANEYKCYRYSDGNRCQDSVYRLLDTVQVG